MPPKEEIVVNVPLSEMQMFWYKRLILNDAELLERVEDTVQQDEGVVAAPVEETESTNDWKRLQSLMMQLRKCCNHVRLVRFCCVIYLMMCCMVWYDVCYVAMCFEVISYIFNILQVLVCGIL
jgi:hypothetical protein